MPDIPGGSGMRRVFRSAATLLAAVFVSAAVTAGAAHAGPVHPGSAGAGPARGPMDFVPTVPGPRIDTPADAMRADDATSVPLTPEGVNDFACRPSAVHPEPVILLHGTDSSVFRDFARLGPALADAGYCVFGIDYGLGPGAGDNYGHRDMTESSAVVGRFVERVRAETGASRVSVIGYSQGASVGRHWVNRGGGAALTRDWIGLASPTRGGDLYGLGTVAAAIPVDEAIKARYVNPALLQKIRGSAWLDELNRGGETVPGVRYSTIRTLYDEVVQPADSQPIRDPAATNILLQDLCPRNHGGHFGITYDPLVIHLVLGLLDPASEQATTTPTCVDVPLGKTFAEIFVADNFG